MNVQLKQKESKFAFKTGKDDISLPAVIVFSGGRGSSKSYSYIALMRHFKKRHYITKAFLLCPKRHSNDLYTNLKTLDKKTVSKMNTRSVLPFIKYRQLFKKSGTNTTPN